MTLEASVTLCYDVRFMLKMALAILREENVMT